MKITLPFVMLAVGVTASNEPGLRGSLPFKIVASDAPKDVAAFEEHKTEDDGKVIDKDEFVESAYVGQCTHSRNCSTGCCLNGDTCVDESLCSKSMDE